MKKIYIALSFVLTLICLVVNNNVYASANTLYSSGDGSSSNPYIITSEEHLKNIKYNLSSHYKLGDNIVLTSDWTPIDKFYGKIDGDFYSIKKMHIEVQNSGVKSGFIGYLYGTIKNIYFNSCSITNSDNYSSEYESHIGIVTGYCKGVINNCYVSDSTIDIKYNRTYVGSIAGTIDPDGSILNSSVYNSSLDITGDAGGLAGVNCGVIADSTADTTITYHYIDSNTSIGGLVGTNAYDASIDNSKSYGCIYWDSPSKSRDIKPYMGKLIGYNAGEYTNCYSGMGYDISYYYWHFIGWYNQSERCFKYDDGYVGYNK